MTARMGATSGALFVILTASAVAHHAYTAEFDTTKPVKVTGVLTRVEWANPHIWIYLDVKDDSGKVQNWQCEGGAPNSLTRNGWTKNDLKKGDSISVTGTHAKDATNTCNASSVVLPDGRKVFAGSSNPDLKQQ